MHKKSHDMSKALMNIEMALKYLKLSEDKQLLSEAELIQEEIKLNLKK